MKGLEKLNHEATAYQTKKEILFKKDIWEAEEIGLKPDASQSSYYVNFTKLNPKWLRDAVKQFIYHQAALRTFSTCRCYITGLIHFGNFILAARPHLKPQDLTRRVIWDYLSYLNTVPSLHESGRHFAVVHLRTFLEISAQENGLPFPKERLIFNVDIPKITSPLPRFIPETVMTQLKEHLATLPGHLRRLIFVLQETGRRIGEICILPFDCLKQDDAKDYFLEVTDKKMKKIYLIPITEVCADTIKEQQQYIIRLGKTELGYLFISPKSQKNPHARARYIHRVLNKLAVEKKIKDANGIIWRFHPHQFRHTVGTRMINAGVSQPIIQRYLGHETPKMTSRYAHIHDKTLKDAFAKFQGKLVNILGENLGDSPERNAEEQWLKHNIMAQALPNGYCGLPLVQQRCPHANACLTCSHFRTNEKFLSLHEKQLEETDRILDFSHKNGWQRQVEMNREVKISLEKIINALKRKN